MTCRPSSILLLALVLFALTPHALEADPNRSALLSPVLSLSGRLGDPEHMVSPLDISSSGGVSSSQSSEPDGFASEAPALRSDAGGGAGFVPAGDDAQFSASSVSASPAAPGVRDFRDTLIQSEQDSRVHTLADESGERFPDSWAGSPVQGAYSGHRRDTNPANYSGTPGAGYSPQPLVGADPGLSPSSPGAAAYDPAGPYAYRYEGFAPMDGPHDSAEAGFEYDADFPLFTRQFDPESAHLKAGPFFFQALWVESGVLYSDYHGPTNFAPGFEDGWLGYSSLRFRMTARLSPSLHMTGDGEVIYLYGTNELGFRSGIAGGPFASIVYETEMGAWDVRAFAEIGTGSFQDAFGSEAFDQAGRYLFGFMGRYDDGLLYDPYLFTRVGVEATTLVNPDWRLTLAADHTDYWMIGGDSDDDHWAREHAGVLLGAEPDRVPFSPWFSYDLYSDDYFDSVYHTVYAGGSGRLSQNVSFDGRVGYFWESGDLPNREHWLWNAGLNHRLSERTSHGIRAGQDFFMSDFSVDSTVSNFFQYYISHELTDRLRLHAYAQWSTDEFLTGPFVGGEYESEIYGVWLHNTFSDRLTGSVGYLEETRSSTQSAYEYERSILQARFDLSLGTRTSAYFLYQHEDTDLYYEDLYMTGIRRSF